MITGHHMRHALIHSIRQIFTTEAELLESVFNIWTCSLGATSTCFASPATEDRTKRLRREAAWHQRGRPCSLICLQIKPSALPIPPNEPDNLDMGLHTRVIINNRCPSIPFIPNTTKTKQICLDTDGKVPQYKYQWFFNTKNNTEEDKHDCELSPFEKINKAFYELVISYYCV